MSALGLKERLEEGLGSGPLHLCFPPLSLGPGLGGVQSDVVWPFSSGTCKHKDFVKQWTLK